MLRPQALQLRRGLCARQPKVEMKGESLRCTSRKEGVEVFMEWAGVLRRRYVELSGKGDEKEVTSLLFTDAAQSQPLQVQKKKCLARSEGGVSSPALSKGHWTWHSHMPSCEVSGPSSLNQLSSNWTQLSPCSWKITWANTLLFRPETAWRTHKP